MPKELQSSFFANIIAYAILLYTLYCCFISFLSIMSDPIDRITDSFYDVLDFVAGFIKDILYYILFGPFRWIQTIVYSKMNHKNKLLELFRIIHDHTEHEPLFFFTNKANFDLHFSSSEINDLYDTVVKSNQRFLEQNNIIRVKEPTPTHKKNYRVTRFENL